MTFALIDFRPFAVLLGVTSLLVLGGCSEDSPFKKEFVAACEQSNTPLKCGCFFDNAEEALTSSNYRSVLAFIESKNQYSAKQQKAKMSQLVGEDNITTLWRASVSCAKG